MALIRVAALLRPRVIFAAGALALAVLVAAAPAEACSVCFSAREENRIAFLVTTIFLSVLPLTLIGSAIWWLRRRIRQLEAARPLTERG